MSTVENEIEDLKLRVTELEKALFGSSIKIAPDEGDEKEEKPPKTKPKPKR